MVTKKRAASKVSKSVFSGTMHNVLAESIAALSSCFSASRVTSIRSCIDIPYYPILSNISFTYPILSNRFLDTLLCSGKCQTCHCRTSDGKSIFDPIQAHSLSSKYACLQKQFFVMEHPPVIEMFFYKIEDFHLLKIYRWILLRIFHFLQLKHIYRGFPHSNTML